MISVLPGQIEEVEESLEAAIKAALDAHVIAHDGVAGSGGLLLDVLGTVLRHVHRARQDLKTITASAEMRESAEYKRAAAGGRV